MRGRCVPGAHRARTVEPHGAHTSARRRVGTGYRTLVARPRQDSVRDLPDDDEAIAVLADRLAEQGDPMGEWLAASLADRMLEPHAQAAVRRADAWFREIRRHVELPGTWERGRLRGVRVRVDTSVPAALDALVGLHTLRRLDLSARPPPLRRDRAVLWDHPVVRGLDALALQLPGTWITFLAQEIAGRPMPRLEIRTVGGLLAIERGPDGDVLTLAPEHPLIDRDAANAVRALPDLVRVIARSGPDLPACRMACAEHDVVLER